jgi:hypothetical protein
MSVNLSLGQPFDVITSHVLTLPGVTPQILSIFNGNKNSLYFNFKLKVSLNPILIPKLLFKFYVVLN